MIFRKFPIVVLMRWAKELISDSSKTSQRTIWAVDTSLFQKVSRGEMFCSSFRELMKIGAIRFRLRTEISARIASIGVSGTMSGSRYLLGSS